MAESVDVVERVVDAFDRADVDALTALLSQDFEFDFSDSRGPMSAVYRGRDGAREFLTTFFEPWAEFGVTPLEMTELEDGRVLTVSTIRARGHESGAEVAATGAMIWTIRDGDVAAAKMYQTKGEALEAAGLTG